MLNLSDPKIKELDPQNTIGSTDLLFEQLNQALEETTRLTFKKDYSGIENIVFCGMGASIYGALVLRSLLGEKNPYPMEFVSDYHLPSYVSPNTLVVLTSYSGSTEEVLSCAEEAKSKNAKCIVLTKGGKLGEFADTNAMDSYQFDGALNPAGVPRLGLGYTVVGLLGLFSKLDIVDINLSNLKAAISSSKMSIGELKDEANNLAEEFHNKIPIVISAEHLSGNAQILRNQFNETSKMFSAFFLIPDLNHHLMEGLKFPQHAELEFLVIDSDHYTSKNKSRSSLTRSVIEQNNRTVKIFNPKGANAYEDVIKTMAFGSYLTLFLGLLNRQNPATNPWVDYFKDELKKLE